MALYKFCIIIIISIIIIIINIRLLFCHVYYIQCFTKEIADVYCNQKRLEICWFLL